MKLSSRLFALAALALLAVGTAPAAHADDDDHRYREDGRYVHGGPHRGEVIVSCGSSRGAPNYCRADLTRLRFLDLQQQSRADCIRGETFGFDRHGVWVRGGCRAHFWFVPGRGGYGRDDGPRGYDPRDGWGRTLVCASQDGRRNWCPVPPGARVELLRQVSRAACIRGRSWDVDRGGIWVDEGCRAEFGLRDRRG